MYSKEQMQKLQSATKYFLNNTAIENDFLSEVNALREVLRFHEYRYYVLDDPLISDFEYDSLYKLLEKIESEDPKIITPDSPTQRIGNSLNTEFIPINKILWVIAVF